MKILTLTIIFFVMLLSVTAQAHDRFLADVRFESWERHCHKSAYKYGESGEEKIFRFKDCWAVYQKKFQTLDDYEVGFAVIVDQEPSRFSLEIISINMFGTELEVQIDQNPPQKFACHAEHCTPWGRDDAVSIVEQMLKGKMMVIRPTGREHVSDILEEAVPLDGFTETLGRERNRVRP